MENTDFVIEHIDEEVKVIADQPSVVTNYPVNTDFFIENIDSNVISIAHSLNIEASEVDFRPANTDFFIENIDKNVIAIAESMNLSPSEVDFRPANTDFFVENIDKNLIEIAESLFLTPYEVTIRPANTDMFIENIDKNVTLIKGSTNVVTVSGEYININLPDGGKVQSAQIDGNATQTGTPTPTAPVTVNTTTGENVVKITGKNLWGGLGGSYNRNTGGIDFQTNTDGTIAASGLATSTVFSCSNSLASSNNIYTTLKAGTYYLSSESTPPTGVSVRICKLSDGTTLAESPHSFTLAEDTNVYISLRVASGTNISNGITIKPMLEQGSTATSYQAYTEQSFTIDLGNEELAKIGTYQDRIYKDGEKWYVEKQVGKVVLDGSETWVYNSSYGYNGFRYRNDDFNISSNNPSEDLICSHFTVATVRGASPTAPVIKTYAQNTDSMYIFLCDGTSDVDAFKTWLASNNTTVYYALATPTTTEITDQTLIDQLEALASATLGYGANNIFTEIATGNAMPTLELVIEKY